MQAIILAAGMGKRLKELTQNATKCMVEVQNKTMIERALESLEKLSLNRIILVVGYEAKKLEEYVLELRDRLSLKTPVEFINNTIYDKTNNIYSLYLAKDEMLKDDTLLLESDIVFEDALLKKLVDDPYPSLALVAKYESWMDGTVVELDAESQITKFISKKEFDFTKTDQYYKTVNIYKFSREFAKNAYIPFLEAYCQALGHNEYYEQVLKVITLLDQCELRALKLDDEKWYEIDDVQDLDIAESIFAEGEERLERISSRYGGYWRYEHMADFCYLVNPYYPCKKLKAELKANFDRLLTAYPSGMAVNSLVAAKTFALKREQVVVGNGAAELIKALMEEIGGKIGVTYPTFEEYPNRLPKERIEAFHVTTEDFTYTVDDLMTYFEGRDIQNLLVINPDNPSGNYINKTDMQRLLSWCEEKSIRLIIDESFLDFAETGMAYGEDSLLNQKDLTAHPSMILVKSISKSYGVPGLRLGILAGCDAELIKKLKKSVAIWNINSFGEYYLQIAEKYQKDYEKSLTLIRQSRNMLYEGLKKIRGIKPFASQANYLLCEVEGSAKELCITLLEKYNILIKDCTKKCNRKGKSYVRIAVLNEQDNQKLLTALEEIRGKY